MNNLVISSYRKQAYFIMWERFMEKSCYSVKEHATDIFNFEKKKTLPLTKEELKSHLDTKNC